MGGLGFEYRVDDINSLPDDVARDGLFFGFFADGGAVGDKATTEFFGEIELPILADMPGADQLILNLSARYTDDELYGSDTTGSANLAGVRFQACYCAPLTARHSAHQTCVKCS